MRADKFASSLTHVIRQWGKPMGEPIFKEKLKWAYRCYERSNDEPEDTRAYISCYGTVSTGLSVTAAWNAECGFNPGGRKGAFGTTTKMYSASGGHNNFSTQDNFTLVTIREIFPEESVPQEPTIFSFLGNKQGQCFCDLEQGIFKSTENASAQAGNPAPGAPAFSWMMESGSGARMNGMSIQGGGYEADNYAAGMRFRQTVSDYSESSVIASCFWDVRFYTDSFSKDDFRLIMEDMRENYRYYTGKDIDIPDNF